MEAGLGAGVRNEVSYARAAAALARRTPGPVLAAQLQAALAARLAPFAGTHGRDLSAAQGRDIPRLVDAALRQVLTGADEARDGRPSLRIVLHEADAGRVEVECVPDAPLPGGIEVVLTPDPFRAGIGIAPGPVPPPPRLSGDDSPG